MHFRKFILRYAISGFCVDLMTPTIVDVDFGK